MKRNVCLVNMLLALALAAPAPSDALTCNNTNPDCGCTISGPVTLTQDMACTGQGYIMLSNTSLDCQNHKIIGSRLAIMPVSDTLYGLKAFTASGVSVTNCTVTGFDRGLYFKDVNTTTVNRSQFSSNTKYGATLTGSDSYGNTFDSNKYLSNGDEGIHISGPFGNPTSPNRITNSVAAGNVQEGFYLLEAHYVELGGNRTKRNNAEDNDAAGLYIKASDDVRVSYLTLEGDALHVFGDSDRGIYSYVTVAGAFVKLEQCVQGENSDNCVVDRGFPKRNTFDHICVVYLKGTPEGAPRSAAFVFKNVGAAAGDGNTINSSAALLTGSTGTRAVEVDDSVRTGDATNNNAFVDLWVVPWSYGGYQGANESLSSWGTGTHSFKNKTSPWPRPACFGLTGNDFNGDGSADILWRSNQ